MKKKLGAAAAAIVFGAYMFHCSPNPTLVSKVDLVLKDLKAQGFQPVVSELCRTPASQAEKVAKGYSQTYNSLHLKGRAVDIVDKRYMWNIPLSHPFWKALGKACKKQGLEWGGDWKTFKDVAHCQMPRDMK